MEHLRWPMVFRPSEFRTNDTGPKIEKDGYMAKKNCPKNLLNKRSLCSFALSWQIRCNRSVKEKLLSLAKQISCLEVFSSCLSASIEEHLPFQRSRKEEKEWERKKSCWNFWNNDWFSLDVIARVYAEWSIMHGKRLWELDGGATVRPKQTDCWKKESQRVCLLLVGGKAQR